MAGEGDDGALAATARGAAAGSERLEGTLLQRGAAVGPFVVDRVLGHGGSGVVLLARDPALDRSVALKILRPSGWVAGADDLGRARLLREAQAMARLRHPNVVTVYQVGETAGQVFIAMEYVAGGTLREWLAQPCVWREVVRRFRLAGRGLAAAHAAGMVHRDFKPDNVLVTEAGGVLVTDFGLVGGEPRGAGGAGADAGLTVTDAVMGTPRYMSPEQHRGAAVDARADQFSFCASLYEALFGALPFAGETREELAAHASAGTVRPIAGRTAVPRWLRRAVLRGLRPAPGDRHRSMDDLLAALDPRRHTRRVATLVASAALVFGGATTSAVALRGGGEPPVITARPLACGPGAPSYMPLAVGNWWRYRVVEGQGGRAETKTIAIDALAPMTGEKAGVVAYRLRREDSGGGATRWLRDRGDAIVWDGDVWYASDGAIRSSRTFQPHRMRAPEDCARTTVGASWQEHYDRVDVSPGGERKVTPQIETWTVVAVERVTVPAGTFDALRINRRNAAERIDSTYWFAPGVGKVKEDSPPKESEELIAFQVGAP